MNTILTDDERREVHRKALASPLFPVDALIQETEAAVLAKLREQEPLFWVRFTSAGFYEGPIHNAQIESVRKESGAWTPLYAAPLPAVVQVPQGWKLVPVRLLERASASIGSFVSDHGWSQEDVDTMDGIDAMLAAAPEAPAQLEHITDGTPCWCEPELDYKNPETGAEVWVHRGKQ